MSHDSKITLNSFIAWVVLSGFGLLAGVLHEDEYAIFVAIAGVFAIGAALSAGLLLTGLIILSAKLDYKPSRRLADNDVLEEAAGPLIIPYRERGLAFIKTGGMILLIGGSVCLGML